MTIFEGKGGILESSIDKMFKFLEIGGVMVKLTGNSVKEGGGLCLKIAILHMRVQILLEKTQFVYME